MGSNPSDVYWMDICLHWFVAKIVLLAWKDRKYPKKRPGLVHFLQKTQLLEQSLLTPEICGSNLICLSLWKRQKWRSKKALDWWKHRWCTWDSNSGRQDGGQRRIHSAIVAPSNLNFFRSNYIAKAIIISLKNLIFYQIYSPQSVFYLIKFVVMWLATASQLNFCCFGVK